MLVVQFMYDYNYKSHWHGLSIAYLCAGCQLNLTKLLLIPPSDSANKAKHVSCNIYYWFKSFQVGQSCLNPFTNKSTLPPPQKKMPFLTLHQFLAAMALMGLSFSPRTTNVEYLIWYMRISQNLKSLIFAIALPNSFYYPFLLPFFGPFTLVTSCVSYSFWLP